MSNLYESNVTVFYNFIAELTFCYLNVSAGTAAGLIFFDVLITPSVHLQTSDCLLG